MYTKKQIAKELKSKIHEHENIAKIGKWAHDMFLEEIVDSNKLFNQLLLDLGTMSLGPEFEYTYEELNVIADKLIAGEDVIL